MARLASGLCVVAVLLLAAGCTPDIGVDTPPEVMEFDPAASPPRAAEPTFAVENQKTGLIDLSLGGIVVPLECDKQTAIPQAQCEFFQYLQTLDGFPTSSPARTPVSAAVNLATVPGNVVVVNSATKQVISDAVIGYDPKARYLTVAPARRWDVGGFYWIGVRGYDKGLHALHATNGQPFVASVPYALLKRTMPLTCSDVPIEPGDISADCAAVKLLSQSMTLDAARGSVFQLEALRQAFLALNGWGVMEEQGLPKNKIAILWGFRTHSGPVIDIDPIHALAPAVVAPDEIDLTINGALDPATVKSFSFGSPGSLVLMDLTLLAASDLTGFTRNSASVNGTTLAIKTDAPLVKGHTYGIIISKGASSPAGKALVLPPVSAFLMAKGKLFDGGQSTVSTLSAIEAALLEPGRVQLAPLLASNSAVWQVTGLQQKDVAYLFAFDIP